MPFLFTIGGVRVPAYIASYDSRCEGYLAWRRRMAWAIRAGEEKAALLERENAEKKKLAGATKQLDKTRDSAARAFDDAPSGEAAQMVSRDEDGGYRVSEAAVRQIRALYHRGGLNGSLVALSRAYGLPLEIVQDIVFRTIYNDVY